MSTEDLQKAPFIKYKEIIFVVDSHICTKCLNELWKQQIIDDKVSTKNLRVMQ